MEPKIKLLIDHLLDKTKKKEANWDRIGTSDSFQLFLDNGRVAMDKFVSNKGNLFYQFSIINLNEDNILTINKTKELNKYPIVKDKDNDDYELLRGLHVEIRKAYFKVEETIEELLSEISKDGEIGKGDPNPLPF